MNPAIIVAAILFLIALALGMYFIFGKKNCKKIATQAKCKAPCKWDTYGGKCIDKDTDPTPAPTADTPPTDTSAALASATPTTAPTPAALTPPTMSEREKKKMQCLAGRYHETYKKYEDGGLDEVKAYYDEFGKAKGLSTSCELNDYEATCYAVQNKEPLEAFGYDKAKLKKHYNDYGREQVARFNCRGGNFFDSVLPEDATLIYQGQISGVNKTPNNGWYLHQQDDGNLVWVNRGSGTQWNLASHVCGNGTAAILQGDGNICVYSDNFATDGCAKCTMSHNPSAKGHLIVAKDDGTLYVDHGDGEAGRSYIYEP